MPSGSNFSDHQKKIMLENAVSSVGLFSAITDQSDQNFSNSGRELTCDKHSNVLLLEATN